MLGCGNRISKLNSLSTVMIKRQPFMSSEYYKSIRSSWWKIKYPRFIGHILPNFQYLLTKSSYGGSYNNPIQKYLKSLCDYVGKYVANNLQENNQ